MELGDQSSHIEHDTVCTENPTTNNEPYLGQEFDDLDTVYSFYNFYAKSVGFGIRKNSSIKCQITKELKWKSFVCDKAGKKIISTDEIESLKRRRDTRVGCKAKLGVKKSKSGKWVIRSYNNEHNHCLDTPRRTKKHRSHHASHRSKVVREAMDQLHDAGMRPCNIAKILNVGENSKSISSQNVIDHLRVKRKSHMGREGVIVAQYLQAQLLKDPNFFFALELDTDGYLKSLFWVDSRARTDYITFGDVIVFDVTYKTNKFMMPFAPFTGVNHHRQSILFGCALLADETEDTFIWLFNQWLKCMFDRHPKTIITDMDLAMYNAIKIVFPNTHHRFCSWHINKHLVEHVSEMRDPHSEFSTDYWSCYHSKSVASFESAWISLIRKYQLESHKWLTKMWERRYHWIPAFLKEVFVASMSSTGRSESMNAFFDGFVNSNTALDEFVIQYEHALETRRHSEEIEDFKTMNSVATLLTKTTLEAHAGERYTRSIFKLFQSEFKQGLECWHEKVRIDGNLKVYSVGLSLEDRHKWNYVGYDDSDPSNVKCECAKFQNDGILCKHVLHIMCKKQLTILPEKFILKRWTIDARHMLPFGSTFENSGTHLSVTPVMKWTLSSLCNKLVERVSKSETDFRNLYDMVTQRLDAYDTEGEETTNDNVQNQTEFNASSSSIPLIHIRDPMLVRRKGRPKVASRIPSGIELSQNFPKQRTCGLCGNKGHYSTTCPMKGKDKVVD